MCGFGGRRRRGGFTLLELCLAMAMMAMLALTLYMAMTIALRARDSAGANVAPVRAATAAAELVRQDLESVLPPTGTLAGPFEGYSNGGLPNGRSDGITFYCVERDVALGDAPLAEGIRRVDLMVRTDVTPPILVRDVSRNLLAQADVPPDEEILCRNVRSFGLRYFDGVTWQEEWDSTTMGDVLPMAVEMTLDVDVPPLKAGGQPTPYRVIRVIPLACAKPSDVTGMGGF
jgi:prepilin-type N-terminal cleavage/methylation domain-containing protein